MLKNISSIKLIGVLALLVLVYLGIEFFGKKPRSKSFKAEIVTIDTAKVTRILIDGRDENLELIKEQNAWKVSIGDGKFAEAQKSSVKGTLNSLLTIKPSRVAAKSPEKWKEYQVDTSGTRIQVFEGSKNTLDLVIGRFGFDQQALQQQQMMGGRGGMQQFYSYVRPYKENSVYVAENFMGMSINARSGDFRNKKMLSLTTDSIASIQFNYPADSAFVLNREDDKWSIFGVSADSASVAEYLSDIRYINGTDFVDDVPPTALVSPTVSLRIVQNGIADVEVKAFRHPLHKWILHSSENPASYFADEKLVERIFVGRQKLAGV